MAKYRRIVLLVGYNITSKLEDYANYHDMKILYSYETIKINNPDQIILKRKSDFEVKNVD